MPSGIVHDAPEPGRHDTIWGSDLIASVLRELDIPYIAHVPGSSYRGLHDSIVNYLGNRSPQLVLALHEEAAIAIAHGYAKVAGRMMAAAVHANVGLFRAPMAVYNAWCDRVPLLLLGATGPADASQRDPTDWIHSSADQGSLVRNFTKWDDQPHSPAAAVEALLRAAQIAQTAPRGPVYVNLEVEVQERSLGAMPPMPDVARYAPPSRVFPAPEVVVTAAEMLSSAKNPVILLGRCSRSADDWDARVALAEKLDAPVLTDRRNPAAFPTDHPLHPVRTFSGWVPPAARAILARADIVLALDWPDLAHTLAGVYGTGPVTAKVIRVSCDAHNHRGWSLDHQALPPSDLYMMCEPDAAVAALLETTRPRVGASRPTPEPTPPTAAGLSSDRIFAALETAARGTDICFTRLPFDWNGDHAVFRQPLDSIGYDGGSGIGSGPGITVGAGLALHGSGRIPIGVMGDGDFMMGNAAVWTAAHYGIACLMIVRNNRSFLADESHQARIAAARSRPAENRWIGTRLEDPIVDLAALAAAQGAVGIGPVTELSELEDAIGRGLDAARGGQVCVLDVHTARTDVVVPSTSATRARAKRLVRRLESKLTTRTRGVT